MNQQSSRSRSCGQGANSEGTVSRQVGCRRPDIEGLQSTANQTCEVHDEDEVQILKKAGRPERPS
jgi:hypothetical protein